RASPSQIRVTLGAYVLNSDPANFASETIGVSDIKVHPQFRFTPQADRFDVAVLKLERPIMFKSHIRPICLPRKGEVFEGAMSYVAGWGATEPGIIHINRQASFGTHVFI